jgi:hypothetical protein
MAPAVGFETVKGPHWDPCGGFEWTVRFFITDKPGAAVVPARRSTESWVLQHFQRFENYENCDGSSVSLDPDDYWEAWRIGTDGWTLKDYSYAFDGTNKYPVGGGAEDNFTWPNQPGTWGDWRIESFVYWLETVPDDYLTVTRPHRGIGDLPHAGDAPAGLDPGSWSLHRWVSSRWSCCDDTRGGLPPGTLIGRAVAVNGTATYEERWRNNKRELKRVDE